MTRHPPSAGTLHPAQLGLLRAKLTGRHADVVALLEAASAAPPVGPKGPNDPDATAADFERLDDRLVECVVDAPSCAAAAQFLGAQFSARNSRRAQFSARNSAQFF